MIYNNLNLLKTKVDSDFSGATLNTIYSSLNQKNILVKDRVPTLLVKQYLLLTGFYFNIESALTVTTHTAKVALDTFEYFDIANPIIEAKLIEILDLLILETNTPQFTTQDKNYILSLGEKNMSWAEINGFPDGVSVAQLNSIGVF